MTVEGVRRVKGAINKYFQRSQNSNVIYMLGSSYPKKPIQISESISIGTSFPGFIEKFKEIGANLSSQKNQ